ncbi:hypothetical protein [Enterobacter hormaechei]|uniref:hypothetical protein n=1 Tax=Enterobacter hormaechei TaxID=158836 RepID=UPI00334626FF
MNIETLKDILARLDAQESVIQRMIGILTPEQLEQFHERIKRDWEAAEKNVSPDLAETLQRTKKYALKISGAKI